MIRRPPPRRLPIRLEAQTLTYLIFGALFLLFLAGWI
jgi:hypothetical protein